MASAGSSDSDLDLLVAHEPVVRYTEGELFFPASVEDYVAECQLLEQVPSGRPRVLLDRSEVTLERLAAAGAKPSGHPQFLRFVTEPFGRTQQIRWSRRSGRPRFRRTGRLARVGVLSRVVDALMRFSLFFRGSVARGAEAAAETRYRETVRVDHHPYYGRVVRERGYVVLQYWFFYVFNDWRSRAYGVNDHEADWEQVIVYLAEQPQAPPRPSWVVFSAHDETGDDLRRRWDDPDLTLIGDHPVVHAGLGSHSGAYLSGEYLTTFEAPAFHGLIRFVRRISRTLLPWTRDQDQTGVGIPYVDYARGDGPAIGPGQDRQWAPVLIDDDTPWVFDYRGLWGNDTEDPFGGERAPAGPRYERSGSVRRSWGDPIGWSGLAKVAPNREAASDIIRRRLDELEDEATVAGREIDELETQLRADAASGIDTARVDERRLTERVAHRVALRDERRRLGARLSNPPEPGGPHDHLRHRRLPSTQPPRHRRRILAVWSTVSTPLILTFIAVAFFPHGDFTLIGSATFGVFFVFAIEAVARRNLFRFLATLAVLSFLLGVATTLAGFTVFFGWQTTVAVCFLVLAGLLLINNVRELVRD